jgi:hypothetical protein
LQTNIPRAGKNKKILAQVFVGAADFATYSSRLFHQNTAAVMKTAQVSDM